MIFYIYQFLKNFVIISFLCVLQFSIVSILFAQSGVNVFLFYIGSMLYLFNFKRGLIYTLLFGLLFEVFSSIPFGILLTSFVCVYYCGVLLVLSIFSTKTPISQYLLFIILHILFIIFQYLLTVVFSHSTITLTQFMNTLVSTLFFVTLIYGIVEVTRKIYNRFFFKHA